MKKIISILAVCILSFTLFGCAENTSKNDEQSRFVQIEDGDYWYIVYDRYTKVMYIVSAGYCSTFTLLVNSDGTPLLYEE